MVADEIRTLSIRCDESAQEIADVIKKGSVDIDEGVELVMRSASVLENTAKSVNDVSHQIHNVSMVINKLNELGECGIRRTFVRVNSEFEQNHSAFK